MFLRYTETCTQVANCNSRFSSLTDVMLEYELLLLQTNAPSEGLPLHELERIKQTMASAEEVQKMMASISKIRNDVLSPMEKQLEQLLNEPKDNPVVTQELEQKFEKELEECRRELEQNYQQQLQKQKEEIKKELFKHFEGKLKNIEELKTKLQNQIDDIRKMFYTLQSESAESHNQILTQEEQYVTTSVTPPETNNLESPEPEITGTYENWGFSNSKIFHLIPITELQKMLNTLVHLDVTVKAQKDEGIAMINQLRAASENLTVTMNRRFPPNGEFYYCGFWVNDLHDILDRIGNECVNVNYKNSKNVVFKKFMQIGNKEGWSEAYNCAGHHYLLDITTPQSRLDQYLWLLCCLVNIEKNYNVSEFEMYNVDTFEKEYDLTWREVEQ